MKITAVLLLDGLMKKWRFKILLLCMSVSFCSNRNIFLIMNMSNLLPKQHAWKIKKNTEIPRRWMQIHTENTNPSFIKYFSWRNRDLKSWLSALIKKPPWRIWMKCLNKNMGWLSGDGTGHFLVRRLLVRDTSLYL